MKEVSRAVRLVSVDRDGLYFTCLHQLMSLRSVNFATLPLKSLASYIVLTKF